MDTLVAELTTLDSQGELIAAQNERAHLEREAEQLFIKLISHLRLYLHEYYNQSVRTAIQKHAPVFNLLPPNEKSALKRAVDTHIERINTDIDMLVVQGINWPHQPANVGEARVKAALGRPMFPLSAFAKVVRDFRLPLQQHLERVRMFSHDTWTTHKVGYATTSDPVYRLAKEDNWPDSLLNAYLEYSRAANRIDQLDMRLRVLEAEYERNLALETWDSL